MESSAQFFSIAKGDVFSAKLRLYRQILSIFTFNQTRKRQLDTAESGTVIAGIPFGLVSS